MMTNQTLELIQNRHSIKGYDTSFKLSQDEVKELLTYAGYAPSAWNLQHWKFIAVHSDKAKAKLLPIAFNQQQVAQASVTIIVLGNKKANENAEKVLSSLKGSPVYDNLIANINQTYQIPGYGDSQAYLNAGLATMQLINAATAKGLATNPMGGFDPVQMAETFDIDTNRYVPAVIVTIGKAAGQARPSTRFSVEETTQFI